MIGALGATKQRPEKGDEVRFDNGRYFLTFKEGQPAIFHDGNYIKFDRDALYERYEPGGRLYWMVDSTKTKERPKPAMTMFKIEVGIKGERLTFDIMSTSEGRAKNSAVGKVAKKLGVTLQLVWAMLARDNNFIRVIQ
jgi:hypothetical protein